MSSLERQVDPSFHELILALFESFIEGVQVAFLDASSQRQEELLQVRVRLQQFLCREGMGGEEMTWDKVGQDQSIWRSVPELSWKPSPKYLTHSLFLRASLWQIANASARRFSAYCSVNITLHHRG